MKKPKTTKQTNSRKPASPRQSQPRSTKIPPQILNKNRMFQKIVGGLVAALGLFFGALELLPKITISTSTPSEGSYPLNQQFTFTNASIIPLKNIFIDMPICQISAEKSFYSEDNKCDYDRNGSLVFPGWAYKAMQPDESITVSPGERIAGKMAGVDIAFRITYEPWFIPWKKHRTFAFKTKTAADGHMYWNAIPLE